MTGQQDRWWGKGTGSGRRTPPRLAVVAAVVARLAVVAAVVATLVAPALPAHAVSMSVHPGEVVIDDNGLCSLREAIVNANDDAQTHDDCPAGSGADHIFLPSVTYDLSVGLARDQKTGLPAITSEVHIRDFPEGTIIVLDAGHAVRHFRVTSEGDLHLVHIRLVNGHVESPSTGGAISNDGKLTLALSQLIGNSAEFGGAIVNFGETTAVSTSLSENSAGSDGGGIYNFSGSVHLSGTTFTGNMAEAGGGAIANFDTATIDITWLKENSAGTGGGIYNNGSLAIAKTTLSGNSAVGGGGINSTQFADLAITNSTLSDNSASLRGGGIDNAGGLALTNSTLADNSAFQAGGVYLGTGQEQMRNTVVARSEGENCAGPLAVVNPSAGTHNLDDDDTCHVFVQGFTTASNAHLGPLAFHGGAIPVHLPKPWSPAVHAGHQPTCDAISPNTDQRGAARTTPPACDIGSVEVKASEGLQLLIEDVRDLPRLDLGLRTSLLSKLEAAHEAFEREDATAAAGELGAFGNHVRAQRGKKIAAEDADRLIAGASNVRASLTGEPREER